MNFNYIVDINFLIELSLIDNKNVYTAYSFVDVVFVAYG